MRGGALGRRLDLGARGAGPAIGDVVGDAGAEDERLLRHERDGLAQRLRVERGDVDAFEPHRPGARVVEALQKLEQSRFAGARGADDGDRLARRDREIDVAQHGIVGPRRIGEGHPVERHRAADGRGQAGGRGRGDDLRLRAPSGRRCGRRRRRPGSPRSRLPRVGRASWRRTPRRAGIAAARRRVMRWSMTSRAPSHSTTTTLAKARKMAMPVTKERAFVMSRAAS